MSAWRPDRAGLVRRYLPALMLVAEGERLRRPDGLAAIDAAIRGGVNMVQLRDKSASINDLTATIRTLREVIRGRAPLFINSPHARDLPEGGDGLHVPEGSALDYGGDVPLSVAAHSVEAAVRAESGGADLVVLGTVFQSRSHAGGATIGLGGVREVCTAMQVPVIGIGGITAENAGDVIRAGASGVAVISAIFDAADPRAAATALRRAVDEAAR